MNGDEAITKRLMDTIIISKHAEAAYQRRLNSTPSTPDATTRHPVRSLLTSPDCPVRAYLHSSGRSWVGSAAIRLNLVARRRLCPGHPVDLPHRHQRRLPPDRQARCGERPEDYQPVVDLVLRRQSLSTASRQITEPQAFPSETPERRIDRIVPDEPRLPGGNTGGAVRLGDTVRRVPGRWTPSVHVLLRHLEAVGFDGAPRALGFDDQGREVLSFLPGEVVGATRPWPSWVHSDDALRQVAGWLRDYHTAVANFVPPSGAVWREGGTWRPGLIVGHNDAAPYNAAWANGHLVGFFDWDLAAPVTREWDLAFTAFAWVPLHARHVVTAEGFTAFADRPGRPRRKVRTEGQPLRHLLIMRAKSRDWLNTTSGARSAGDCSPHCSQRCLSWETSARSGLAATPRRSVGPVRGQCARLRSWVEAAAGR
jgi:hypothetical protein